MGPSSCFPGLLPRLSSFLKCHPGLTKKRVELVPWSTAPTSGPKTAFFAAAMKPASGRRAIATRFLGNGGGVRGRWQVQRDMRSVTAERSDRAPGCPLYRCGVFSPRPSGSGPAPNRVPQDSGGVSRGGAVSWSSQLANAESRGRYRQSENCVTSQGGAWVRRGWGLAQ